MFLELKVKPEWKPSASLLNLRRRAELLQQIRQFFIERQVLEVETPLLSRFTVTDVHLDSFKVPIVQMQSHEESLTHDYYLQTSPEYAMKRLLAAGSGSIYQITKAFRGSEKGNHHNPEFTLLEWYRISYNHHQLMDEIACLLEEIAGITSTERYSYQQLFETYCKLDVINGSIHELHKFIQQQSELNILNFKQLSYDDCLNIILTHFIEPQLTTKGAVFIYDFPRSQAALAKISADNPQVAHRFELYLNGREIANGFYELTNADEQCKRFKDDQQKRRERQQSVPEIDHRLLAALAYGLPSCSGVALGIDRLLMYLTRATHIDEVISFAWEHA